MNLGQLQVLTEYSLLASTNRIPELIRTAKKKGYTSLAITDKDALHGVISFYETCLKEGIKPIIGMTLSYSFASQYDESIIILAKNNEGYQELMKIATIKGEHDDKIPFELENLQVDSSNLIIIIPSKAGVFSLVGKDIEQQQNLVKQIQVTFRTNKIYCGIEAVEQESEKIIQYQEFYQDLGIPTCAVQDVRYLNPADAFSVDVLEHIESGDNIQIDFNHISGRRYLPDVDKFIEAFKTIGLEEALYNTEEIISQIELNLELHQTLLPKFSTPNGLSSSLYLTKLCEEGLSKRLNGEVSELYTKRLQDELSVIHEMGFDDYFLIVWDVLRHARENNIVTACRGSAAGSLVAYVLQITNVDPIEYGLLFERFLNKERYTMPDIDMDIPDNRRDELLQYVHQTYGFHKVAQIATFGTLAAKMALRDVSRVFGLSQNEASKWANAVPNVLKITLKEAYDKSKKLRDLITYSDKNRLLFDTALRIEGLPRHVSTHAAGVVISDEKLTKYVPLQKGSSNIPLTQFAMKEVETIGLLKMDFLGLRNLSIIGNTLDTIYYHTKKRINLEDIPLDDEKTLHLFRKAQTVGVFQFESSGIKQVLKKLGPTSIEDLASVNALYRPGPMENIDLFVARKKGLKPINYPHPSLQSLLDYTYGVIVYQEQVMQIASFMAGFTLGQSDILRRAISKKEKKVIDQEREHFVTGSQKQGYSKDVAEEVYDYIEKFANYGFNRSHAVVYSIIAYQMAYLKVHYPVYFFQSLLHSVRGNPSKLNDYILEAKDFNVSILPPDINKSEYSFTMSKGKLLYGFSSLKGLRKDFIQHIILVRKSGGNFTSLENFLLRLHGKWLKESNILPLIYIGAFDSIYSNRKQLAYDLRGLIRNIEYSGGSMDLLDVLRLNKEVLPDFTTEEKMEQELMYLGTYVSAHPVSSYSTLKSGRNIKQANTLSIGKSIQLLIYVTSVKQIRTKKGESMAFLEGSDETGNISVTIFPTLYRQMKLPLEEKTVYLIDGRVERSSFNQEIQVIAEKVEKAKNLSVIVPEKRCYIHVTEKNDTVVILNQLIKILKQYPGKKTCVLIFKYKGINKLLGDQFLVSENEKLIEDIENLLGSSTIVFK